MFKNEMLMLGGNLSEESVSPQTPLPKTFCDVSVGTVTSALKAQKVSEGGCGGEALFKEFPPRCPDE
jgi:hypothetical protein